MDNATVFSIIVAIIAIVPGLWAVINQMKKDVQGLEGNMFKTMQHTVYEILPPIQAEISRLKTRSTSIEEISVEEIWKKMYEKPVIIRCSHCKSPNVITSLNCKQCGAPLE